MKLPRNYIINIEKLLIDYFETEGKLLFKEAASQYLDGRPMMVLRETINIEVLRKNGIFSQAKD